MILSSSNLAPHNMICIAWVSKSLYTTSDIYFFANVWRTRVIKVLRWLKANNLLYKDIIINLNLLYIWENKFVLVSIVSNVLQCKSDFSKWKGYVINLEFNNFENELHQPVNTTGLDNSSYLSGCLYINADNTGGYPITKLVLTLANQNNSEISIDPISKVPVLTYQIISYIILLNDWKNVDYFMAIFLTFFLEQVVN